MSGTTLDLTLTKDRLTEWEQPGVNVYAVLFQGSSAGIVTALVSDGSVTSEGSIVSGGTAAGNADYNITMAAPGGTLNGGKVYFIAQSGGASISSLITNQSAINSTNAASYDFSYDSVELSLLGKSTDAANLTAVNGFALPMEIADEYGSAGYAVPGDTIVSALTSAAGAGAVSNYTTGPLAGDFMMSTSPSVQNSAASAGTIFLPSDWQPYITAMETIATSGSVTISGLALTAPQAFYNYHLVSDGPNFWLDPATNSQVQGYIYLPMAEIENSIYAQNGTVSIYSAQSTNSTLLDTISVGANNAYGAVLAQFLTGFTGGYYGQAGISPNSQATAPINLDQNINWDPNYAFHNDTTTVTSPGTGVPYDQYSKVFFDELNSYGSGYSDALMQGYAVGGPQLPVASGSGVDVSALDVTIFGTSEQPTGYVTPENYDYIAPGVSLGIYNSTTIHGYAPASDNAGNNIVLSFDLSDNGQLIGLDSGSEIEISYLTSENYNADTGTVTPVFDTATISGSGTYTVGSGTITSPSLWNTWSINSSGSVSLLSSAPGPQGSMTVDVPTAADGTSWYEITVGAGTPYAKSYNFYGQTDNSGQFINPTTTGQAGQQAIDGLATVVGSTDQSTDVPSLTLNFASGSTFSYNANLVDIPCFAAGTAIETDHGPCPVEALAVGDMVRTISGALKEIRWVGHRTVDCARHPRPAAVRPVRIAAHAFGPGLPIRALDLSPDHAVYAEGVLVPVKYLIYGTTIRQRRVKQVTYYHVELEQHDVILAEGLPTETYLDTGDRASFANADGAAVALHPAWGVEARDIALIMEARGFAPLCVTGAEVARLRAHLAVVAEAAAPPQAGAAPLG